MGNASWISDVMTRADSRQNVVHSIGGKRPALGHGASTWSGIRKMRARRAHLPHAQVARRDMVWMHTCHCQRAARSAIAIRRQLRAGRAGRRPSYCYLYQSRQREGPERRRASAQTRDGGTSAGIHETKRECGRGRGRTEYPLASGVRAPLVTAHAPPRPRVGGARSRTRKGLNG